MLSDGWDPTKKEKGPKEEIKRRERVPDGMFIVIRSNKQQNDSYRDLMMTIMKCRCVLYTHNIY